MPRGPVEPPGKPRWLVLVHQFEADPGSLRVRIWRRLQELGAVALRKSMYVLPNTEQHLEDLSWVLEELKDGGASAAILDATFVAGMSDAEVQEQFDKAREREYAALADEVRDARSERKKDPAQVSGRQLARFQRRLAQIRSIDFFGANGREGVQGLLDELARTIDATAAAPKPSTEEAGFMQASDLKQRVWVTRRSVHVDRIASAWFIRRWIDTGAKFKFVVGDGYEPLGGEIRFDMYEAEFTHVGDRCTFEVLSERFAKEDAALRSVAEIVHDLDLKDRKYDREETPGFARLLSGVTGGEEDDMIRIQRGGELFESLYRAFKGSAG
jgi:hypothetical protein